MTHPASSTVVDLWDPRLAQADAAWIEAAFAAQGERLRRIRAGRVGAGDPSLARAVPLTLEQGLAELERLVLRELARLSACLADDLMRPRASHEVSPARALLEEELDFARQLGLDCAAELATLQRHRIARRARDDAGSLPVNGAGALREMARRFEALAESHRAGFSSAQRSSAP